MQVTKTATACSALKTITDPPLPRLTEPCWLFSISIFFSSSAFSASRLKLAPFCIGGNSRKVWAYFATSCCTKTKRQNS